MKKWAIFALSSILLLAIALRLTPLFQFPVWGGDTGEYYYLTERLLEGNHISFEYEGWGFAYPYFPGMFVLIGAVTFLDLELLGTLQCLIPIIGSLNVLITFLITKRIFRDLRVALASAFFIAVAPFYVYVTAHSMPGTLGEFIALLCILFFFKISDNRKFIALLVPSSIALVFTHHLTTYFLFISVVTIIFAREFVRDVNSKRLRIDMLYLASLFALMIVQWFIIAEPFRERIVAQAFELPAWAIVIIAVLCLLALSLIVRLRRRRDWNYTFKYPSFKRMSAMYTIWIGVVFGSITVTALYQGPGTTVRIDESLIILYAPFFTLIAFAGVGIGFAEFHRQGFYIYAWLWAITISLILSIATDNKVLLPYRHLQYLIAPLAIFVGIGFVRFVDYWSYSGSSVKKGLAISLIALIIIFAPFSTFPPKEVFGNFNEGLYEEDLDAVYWCKGLGNKVILTDHRMSTPLYSFAHLTPTWDAGKKSLHAESFEEAKDEMGSIETQIGYRRVDYVLIDEDLKEGAYLSQWDPAEPLSDDAVNKFSQSPFVKVYDNGYVQVYWLINW